ncbi:MAG: zinc ribbon domain-containing protein [Halobacteriota archaeon]
MPYCPNCGTKNEEGAEICTNCQQPLTKRAAGALVAMVATESNALKRNASGFRTVASSSE